MTIHPSTIALLSGARAIVACKHPERLHTTPTVVAQRSREKVQATLQDETYGLSPAIGAVPHMQAINTSSLAAVGYTATKGLAACRTYYLYSTGRVSQRKLAGRDIKDTVRATSTDAAFRMFQRRYELLTASIQPLTSAL